LLKIIFVSGVKASSFKAGQKVYIDPAQLLPLERFLPQAPKPKGSSGGKGSGGKGKGKGKGFGKVCHL
jgi:H/ACA ribonucleoprotein complex subunit 1